MADTIRLMATKDISSPCPVQCWFSARKGEVITVDRKDWNAGNKVYRHVAGHGTTFDFDGLVELAGSDAQHPALQTGYYWVQQRDSDEWEVAYWTCDESTWVFCEASELGYGGMGCVSVIGPRLDPPKRSK